MTDDRENTDQAEGQEPAPDRVNEGELAVLNLVRDKDRAAREMFGLEPGIDEEGGE